jgi:CheY-like chemotaxis protein
MPPLPPTTEMTTNTLDLTLEANSIRHADRQRQEDSAMNTRTAAPMRLSLNNGRLRVRSIRTFLIEDSPLLMALLARVVSRDERVFIVGAAPEGREAVGSAQSLQSDLVITDLHMPGLDGAAATRLLKQRPDPPIVFVVTSDDTPEARSKSVAAGADAFLVKSANLAPQLLSTIREFFPDEPRSDDRKARHVCESLTTVQ